MTEDWYYPLIVGKLQQNLVLATKEACWVSLAVLGSKVGLMVTHHKEGDHS
jgi:hypothetical protein